MVCVIGVFSRYITDTCVSSFAFECESSEHLLSLFVFVVLHEFPGIAAPPVLCLEHFPTLTLHLCFE